MLHVLLGSDRTEDSKACGLFSGTRKAQDGLIFLQEKVPQSVVGRMLPVHLVVPIVIPQLKGLLGLR